MGEGALNYWLRNLDGGQEEMMQYADVLNGEFDSNLSLIATLKTAEIGETNSIVDCVDPYFWDVVKVSKFSHKLYFARGVATLPSASGDANGNDNNWQGVEEGDL